MSSKWRFYGTGASQKLGSVRRRLKEIKSIYRRSCLDLGSLLNVKCDLLLEISWNRFTFIQWRFSRTGASLKLDRVPFGALLRLGQPFWPADVRSIRCIALRSCHIVIQMWERAKMRSSMCNCWKIEFSSTSVHGQLHKIGGFRKKYIENLGGFSSEIGVF